MGQEERHPFQNKNSRRLPAKHYEDPPHMAAVENETYKNEMAAGAVISPAEADLLFYPVTLLKYEATSEFL